MKVRPASNSRRYRKTVALAKTIVDVLDAYPTLSMSTRQIYYQCVSSGAVTNCVASYDKVQRLVVQLRRSGEIPYERIVDRTRTKHQRPGWDGAAQILKACSHQFRRNRWSNALTVAMIGLEKQALEGVFAEAVNDYGASLWTLHGYGSESFLFEWAMEIKECTSNGQRVVIYYFGDHDATGLDIERAAVDSLHGHGAEFEWARAGLLWSDFTDFTLVNIPVKKGDSRSKKYLCEYGNRAAELDALPPDVLQQRIRRCIENHVDPAEWARLTRDEELQRETLSLVAKKWDSVVATVGGGR
jgi:hypothetical protein